MEVAIKRKGRSSISKGKRKKRERGICLCTLQMMGTSHFTPPASCVPPNPTHQFISIQFTLSSLLSPLPFPQAATSSPIPSPKSPNISFETLNPSSFYSQTSPISFLPPLVCVTKLETCYIPVIFLCNIVLLMGL